MLKDGISERAIIASNLFINDGIITTKTRIVCKTSVIIVKAPCRSRFFLVFKFLTSGNPKTSKKTETTEKVNVKASIN